MKHLLLSLFCATILFTGCTQNEPDLPVEEVSFHVAGMYCDGCVKSISDKMKKIDGATDVRVTLKDSLVVFNIPKNKIPADNELAEMLEELGYELVTEKPTSSD